MLTKDAQTVSEIAQCTKQNSTDMNRWTQPKCSLVCRLFEPYVVECMAELLDKFGDGSDHVRDANSKLAQTIMANLSNAGPSTPLQSIINAVRV